MGADPEPPANAITVTLKRKPVPKKVPTGNPDRPFEYVETTLADNAECGIGISFFIGDDGWPVIKEIGEKGSAHDCPDVSIRAGFCLGGVYELRASLSQCRVPQSRVPECRGLITERAVVHSGPRGCRCLHTASLFSSDNDVAVFRLASIRL